MITKEKINIYKKYRGYFDGYYMQNKEVAQKVIDDEEWSFLEALIQDIYLVRKGLASNHFKQELDLKLKENCENDETIEEVKRLEVFLNQNKSN